MTDKDRFTVRVHRREGPDGEPFWEEFALRFRPGMNVIIALRDIQDSPVTTDGRRTTPVAWECSCLEEVCGACAMLINGVPRQACSTLIPGPGSRIVLEPLSKFPPVRDLIVDRSSLLRNFKKVRAWIPIDLTYGAGPGPRVSQEVQEESYPLSRCITCGCCLEACPQVNARSPFMGAAVLNQVTLINAHPTGHMNRADRLAAVRESGGLSGCGNAQNCARVCPKEIPLVGSIARRNREALVDGLTRWLGK